MFRDSPVFLTPAQALDALAADLGQYGSQPEIYGKIAPLILGEKVKVLGDDGKKRVWIRRNKDLPFEPVADDCLGFYLIHILEALRPEAEDMADICTLVFQTRVSPGRLGGRSGVWVDSQMENFACKRCGNCCRRLDNFCTPEDLKIWEGLGRKDILSRIKPEQLKNGTVQYRWVDPETGKPEAPCPFLDCRTESGKSRCRIQAVKPLVCREYPFTKKHARHTGCLGFEPGK